MKKRHLAAACVLGTAILATPTREASAGNILDLGAQIGYGFNGPDGTVGDENPFGFALGARADIGLLAILTLGANFMYYFGETPVGATENVGFTQIGGTVGLSFSLGPIGLRPYVMLGAMLGRPSNDDNLFSTNSFFIAPGASIVYEAGIFYIGPEVRYTILTGNIISNQGFPNTFGLYGTVGLGF